MASTVRRWRRWVAIWEPGGSAGALPDVEDQLRPAGGPSLGHFVVGGDRGHRHRPSLQPGTVRNDAGSTTWRQELLLLSPNEG